MAASTRAGAAGADPQPTTVAVAQAVASSPSEVLVRCLMPLGRPPPSDRFRPGNRERRPDPIGTRAQARRPTFIPAPSRAGRYDTQAAYKFPCENPRQAFSRSDLFVTFQNGVGPQGTPSTDGTLVEFTLGGRPVSRYSEPLPHDGGTDAISIYGGEILISASAPGTTGMAAPQPTYPAVYVTTLHPRTGIAQVRALYYDEAPAKAVNGPDAGKLVRLALTDPDSNEVVPWPSPRFAGDFMLTSQGDKEQIFYHRTDGRASLEVLSLSNSVDDTAWATARRGALYTTDQTTDTVDEVYGAFTIGTAYSAVTPCDANDAPAVCPAPGFPPNYLATDNLKTGALTAVKTHGPRVHPQGMIFIRL
jgi:hypothetical protein